MLDGHKGLLHGHHVAADISKRRVEHEQGGDKRNKVARGNGAADDEPAAERHGQTETDGDDEMHEGWQPRRAAGHGHRQLEHGIQQVEEFSFLVLFQIIGTNGFITCKSFVVSGVERRNGYSIFSH